MSELPAPAILGIGLLMVALVGSADWESTVFVSLAVFYLVPIALVTWYLRRSVGLPLALLCNAIALTADLHSHVFGAHPLIPYWNAGVRLSMFTIVVLSLDGLRGALNELRLLAHLDPLTGVANARSFEATAERRLQTSLMTGRPVSLGFLDVDDFKRLNDEFGHSIGDRALRVVADIIASGLRDKDFLARLGGDEFGVLLPDTTAEDASAIMDRLRIRIHEAMAAYGWSTTVSIGVAGSLPGGGLDELVTRADRLMYVAKRAGKDRVAGSPALSATG
jgi:diguanylate cyclase (GGDEF)-like protein